jgi:hypothetical protein
MTPVRNHLLATPRLLARGRVTPLSARLVDHLCGEPRAWFRVEDSEVTEVESGLTYQTPSLFLSTAHVVLAHEYVDLGGDQHLRHMFREKEAVRVRVLLDRLPGITLLGVMRNGPMAWDRRFVVIQEPRVEGDSARSGHLATAVNGLPYLLVNRDRIEALYEV